jgi:hypothetical protein
MVQPPTAVAVTVKVKVLTVVGSTCITSAVVLEETSVTYAGTTAGAGRERE